MNEPVQVQDNGITEWQGKTIAEASSIGLKPGEWPEQISLRGEVWEKNFVQTHEDEILAYDYVTERGNRITILND